MTKELILLRGLPGSGKSSLAKSLWGMHIEADMYFGEDVYKFNREELKYAHEWCQKTCDEYMKSQARVVVSNTFTQQWEMQPYIDLAKKHDYKVTTLVVENRHGNSPVHDIPEETIERMRNRFEIKL